MTEYERAKKQIEDIILNWKTSLDEKMTQLLALVEIRADDQSLPLPESISFELNPEFCGDTLMVSPMGIALKDNLLNAYKQAQQDMPNQNWIKVIPKGR